MAVHSALAPSLSASRGLSFRRVMAVVIAMYEARKTRRILAEMDGRLLADIGTSRGDAMQEAGRPFWDIQPR